MPHYHTTARFNRKRSSLLLVVAMLGCSGHAVAQTSSAVVNNSKITPAALLAYQASKGTNAPANNETALQELIDLELLAQDAVKQKLDTAPGLLAELENLRRSTLARARVKKLLEGITVTDEAMQTIYKERIAALSPYEYQLRHILVASESEAKSLLDRLNKGEKFGTLAKEKSLDTSTKESEGLMGWLNLSQVPAALKETISKLGVGDYTKTALQAQNGWHLFMLENRRDLTPPPFDSVKPQIKSLVENQKISEHLAGLRKAAKIETKK